MIDAADSLFLLVQIFFVDLLLGADNAIVIAHGLPPPAARGHPPRDRPRRRRRDRAPARHDPVRQRAARRSAGQARRRLDADRHRAQRAGAERGRRRACGQAGGRERLFVRRRRHHVRRRGDEPRQRGRARCDRGRKPLAARDRRPSQHPDPRLRRLCPDRDSSGSRRKSSSSARLSSAGSPAAWRRPIRWSRAGSTPTPPRSASLRRRSGPCSCSPPEGLRGRGPPRPPRRRRPRPATPAALEGRPLPASLACAHETRSRRLRAG